jgi:hypothetical protein
MGSIQIQRLGKRISLSSRIHGCRDRSAPQSVVRGLGSVMIAFTTDC